MIGGYLYITFMPPLLEDPCHFEVDVNKTFLGSNQRKYLLIWGQRLHREVKISHKTASPR